jgi:non-specific serine/threonine protein kinase
MSKLTLRTLEEERIQKSVNREIYELGQAIYQAGKVQVLEVKNDTANCIVQDKHPYRVQIKVAKNYLYMKCDCRYAYRGTICEHDIAACFGVRDTLKQRLPPTWRNQIQKIIEGPQSKTRKSRPGRYFLFFSLQQVKSYDRVSWKIVPITLAASQVIEHVASPGEPFDHTGLHQWISNHPQANSLMRTPHQLLNAVGCINLPNQAVVLANILVERSRGYTYYSSIFPLDEYLTLLSEIGCPLYYGDTAHPLKKTVQLIIEPGELCLRLTKTEQGINIHPFLDQNQQQIDLKEEKGGGFTFLSTKPIWILMQTYLIKLADQNQFELLNKLSNSAELNIPSRDEAIFRNRYLLKLAEKFKLDGNLVKWKSLAGTLVKRLYLDETEAGIEVELRFAYEGIEVQYDPSYPEETIRQEENSWVLVRVKRDPEQEKAAFEELATASFGLKRTPNPPRPGILTLRARTHPVDFLLNSIPKLVTAGYEIYGEARLKTARVNRNSPTISFQVSSGIDWFDVKAIVNFGELNVSLQEIRRALRKNEKFIKLADGTIGTLPDDWIERYRHLFHLGSETDDGIRLARHHIGLIDQALQGIEQASTDPTFEAYRQKLLNFSGIRSFPLPQGFSGELRPYQIAGYNWLHFLRDYNFHGCLADDMGLGKTIQALALFQSLAEGTHAPDEPIPGDHKSSYRQTSLLVVPRSLLVNWQREASRFTPELRVLEFFQTNREKDTTIFDQYDLVITTYGILLRDIAIFRKYHFDTILLDESQAIKNPLSQSARAVRLLQGKHRLVLTGTPVENSTQELWSQFAFLAPGLLGNLEYFRKEFSTPIEKQADEATANALRRMIYPFILRRTKDQVAPELPQRTERILYCDMEPAQQKLYNRTRDYYRGMILGMLEKEGINNTRFRILEGLLRLRQIANHPGLVDEKYHGESGKFNLLLETIETLKAERHKALIFSQFVQMLRIVRQALDQRQIRYVYLDGRTRNRMELVDAYQKDEDIPFFLISLKAGGQGLNLTAADYVLHIDPWWNPAVEMQASDRTHRIGQDKPVFIFKLITRDSVEEKILQLQDKKRALVNQIITTESSFFKSLSVEDIQILFD